MTASTYLRELIQAATTFSLPSTLLASVENIASQRVWLEGQEAKGTLGPVYGWNTLLGHRDDISISEAEVASLQNNILDSHCLNPSFSQGFYSAFSARLIGLAKVYTLSHGGSGISKHTYELVLNALSTPDFFPQIPVGVSYSSGDVISAAHWVKELLRWQHGQGAGLQRGDGIALINGAFIHIGLASENFFKVEQLLSLVTITGAAAARLSGCSGRTFERPMPLEQASASEALKLISSIVDKPSHLSNSPQVSVSIRAIPEVLIEIFNRSTALGFEINNSLSEYSGNPLVEPDENSITSSASFLALGIAHAQSSLLDSIMFAMRACAARLNYVLSGHIPCIPRDGVASPGVDLGLIQVPKEVTAQIEHAFLQLGRRSFTSCGSTSGGLEDLWTHGESISRQLDYAIDVLRNILLKELAVYELLTLHFFKSVEPLIFKAQIDTGASLVAQLNCVSKSISFEAVIQKKEFTLL